MRIKRPCEVRYDPFTSSVVVLNDKKALQNFAQTLTRDVEQLERAMAAL